MNQPHEPKAARFRVKWLLGWAFMLIGPLSLIAMWFLTFMFDPHFRRN